MTRTTNARIAGVAFLFYIAAGMTSMALAHQKQAREVLTLFTSLSALVLGVTLYSITRDEDADIAMLALTCRVVEAMPGEGAFFFAVGSTLFSWLLLRGRMIPATIARLGVFASALLVVILPLQRAGLLGGLAAWSSKLTWMMWLPCLIFELALAGWLLIKGVAAPAAARSAA